MKRFFLFGLLLLSLTAVAQQTPYQSFEVDSVAEPRGGIAYFNTFVQANLRKPIAAEAAGVGGRVIISAVIEPDGKPSDVKLMNNLRPDFNREALRVFHLFNAWKAAKKGGKAVRQQITASVAFKANQPFVYRDGAQIAYFDADQKRLTDSSANVRFKQVSPLDSNGFANGDIIVYRTKGSSWKEEYRIPFIRETDTKNDSSNPPTRRHGYYHTDSLWEGKVLTFSESGDLLKQTYYNGGKPTGIETTYHPNGLVAQKSEATDTGFAFTSWHPNGQIKRVWTSNSTTVFATNKPIEVTSYWNDAGQQLVKEGNGYAVYTEAVESQTDSSQQTTLVEQGLYQNGLKQGVWTGRYKDGSYGFDEQYDKGICQQGKAYISGSDTLRYTEVEKQAEFKGGMNALGSFLAQNLSYPVNAQRSGAEGKVFIKFVVCTDGTLCDYEVINSVHPELDKEALRVVRKMSGRWKPGSLRGQNVRVLYNLPINFSLH
ncbi:TonB family protein [Spirosoma oryzicola]|uniref:TonB family protein n=1 Tax=Spirosoma oryzicola TaxID=2898794 RepID=UPI001E32C9FA|nr:TonB family protein [Spirosoma oryzicola]UHG91876.1 TonB family protein [Spirosoma oryzicola]